MAALAIYAPRVRTGAAVSLVVAAARVAFAGRLQVQLVTSPLRFQVLPFHSLFSFQL